MSWIVAATDVEGNTAGEVAGAIGWLRWTGAGDGLSASERVPSSSSAGSRPPGHGLPSTTEACRGLSTTSKSRHSRAPEQRCLTALAY